MVDRQVERPLDASPARSPSTGPGRRRAGRSIGARCRLDARPRPPRRRRRGDGDDRVVAAQPASRLWAPKLTRVTPAARKPARSPRSSGPGLASMVTSASGSQAEAPVDARPAAPRRRAAGSRDGVPPPEVDGVRGLAVRGGPGLPEVGVERVGAQVQLDVDGRARRPRRGPAGLASHGRCRRRSRSTGRARRRTGRAGTARPAGEVPRRPRGLADRAAVASPPPMASAVRRRDGSARLSRRPPRRPPSPPAAGWRRRPPPAPGRAA